MDHDAAVSGEHAGGIHLTDKQVVFGVMAASMVVVVAFLCGVFVGRGVQAARPLAEPGADAPPAFVADPELSAPVAVAEGGGALPPDNLTYPGRLNRPDPVPETLAPPPPEAAAADPAPRPARPPAGRGAGSVSAPASPSPRTDGALTVQVAAVRRRAEAQAIVNRLVKKGFPAYVYVPPGSDRTGGFRVRVGSYKTRAEAEAMALRLTKEEQYKPWITR